jgi:hypothetical protein
MPGLSQLEEVRDTFNKILISAHDRLPICGLELSSFFYDLPDNGIAEIFVYLLSIKEACSTILLSDRGTRASGGVDLKAG